MERIPENEVSVICSCIHFKWLYRAKWNWNKKMKNEQMFAFCPVCSISILYSVIQTAHIKKTLRTNHRRRWNSISRMHFFQRIKSCLAILLPGFKLWNRFWKIFFQFFFMLDIGMRCVHVYVYICDGVYPVAYWSWSVKRGAKKTLFNNRQFIIQTYMAPERSDKSLWVYSNIA